VADQDTTSEHLLILCIWQEGADALLRQYTKLAAELPKASNLEVIVVTKKELMKRFMATVQENETTTDQLNSVCRNIGSLVANKRVKLYVDELWVTVHKTYSAHLTMVNVLNSFSLANTYNP
jgi:hypothetical protein